ncbi:MAG: ABC transporter permease, partial [Planctomycetaceae bacterium]
KMIQTMKLYCRVWAAFFRNAWVRESSFQGNFLVTVITSLFWFAVQITLFDLIYRRVPAINDWSREEYFAFMATGMLINALVEVFFLPNCAQFSELIRTGNLDFALLKPIDTQFLVSCEKLDLGTLSEIALAASLLVYALWQRGSPPSPATAALYLLLIGAAVCFFYSLMISLAALSILFGRNQGLLDFWFYVTIFARYPSSIYSGSPAGEVIRFAFSYVLPILLVVTVPAQVLLGKLLEPGWLSGLTLASGLISLALGRGVFQWSLRHYRSASS